MKVVKRNGSSEELIMTKPMEVLEWACSGLNGVTASTVYMNAKLQFFDGIETTKILDTLIKSAADLINEFQPNYQYVAGRLLMTKLRKNAFGVHEPPDFYSHIVDNISLGKYDFEIVDKFSKEEIEELGEYIDHDADMNYAYGAMVQWDEKYLIQNRAKKQHYESPQQALMLIAMCLFQEYSGAKRITLVKDFYDALKDQKLSLPTPIMGGVRSPTRQFSSCTLIESDDSLDSINAVSNAVTRYSSMRAGIGINAGAIRALGSPIRDGEAYHTGAIGFFKLFQSAMGSCSQG